MIHLTDDDLDIREHHRVRTGTVQQTFVMDVQENFSANDRKQLEDLTDQVYQIERFLESEFYSFQKNTAPYK